MNDLLPWSISGTYLEACNCEVICPCRRINGRRGGRPTYGVCKGALSWRLDRGHAGEEVELAGMRVVLAYSFDADETGSPWSFWLYLDDRGDERQRDVLEQVFLGRLGGSPKRQFPWVAQESELLGVRSVPIAADHDLGCGWFRAGTHVAVSIGAPIAEEAEVTSGIPGHHHLGRELHSEQIKVDDEGIEFEVRDRCGYEADFEYWSADQGR